MVQFKRVIWQAPSLAEKIKWRNRPRLNYKAQYMSGNQALADACNDTIVRQQPLNAYQLTFLLYHIYIQVVTRLKQGDTRDITQEEVPEPWMYEIIRDLLSAAQSSPAEDWKDVAECLEKYLVEARLLEAMFRLYSQAAAKVDSIDSLIS